MSPADGSRLENRMKTLFRCFLGPTVALIFLGASARAGDFSDRMDDVHRGMGARSAVAILGKPSSVSQGSGGVVNLIYVTAEGTWRVAVYQGRVVRIEEP
jgi:hypothetical protein